jgi:hypothetical protein
MYLVGRKRMHESYMKLFRRLLNATVLNAMIIIRHNTGKQVDQVPFRISLVEALFEQFADAELKVAGRLAAENVIPQMRERHFWGNGVSTLQRRCVVCTKHGRRFPGCSVTLGCAWRHVFKPLTQNSISRVIN